MKVCVIVNQTKISVLGSTVVFGHALHEKMLEREKCVRTLVRSQETKINHCLADKSCMNRSSNDLRDS